MSKTRENLAEVAAVPFMQLCADHPTKVGFTANEIGKRAMTEGFTSKDRNPRGLSRTVGDCLGYNKHGLQLEYVVVKGTRCYLNSQQNRSIVAKAIVAVSKSR